MLLLLCLNKLKQLRFVEQPTGNPDLKPNWQPFPAPSSTLPPGATLKSQQIGQHRHALPPVSSTHFKHVLLLSPSATPPQALSDIWAKSFEWQPKTLFQLGFL